MKKMMLVPASDPYAQHMLPPAVPQLVNLDNEIRQILDLANVPADMKLLNYNQVLRRYMKMRNDLMDVQYPAQTPQPPEPQAQHEATLSETAAAAAAALPFPDQAILKAIPKKNQLGASLLLDFIKRSKTLSWTDKGEMLVNGHLVPNSNLMDLVSDFSRQRKRIPPAGAAALASALRSQNVPRECIGNDERWRMIEKTPTRPNIPAFSLGSATPGGRGGETDYDTPQASPVLIGRRSSRNHKSAKRFGWDEYQ